MTIITITNNNTITARINCNINSNYNTNYDSNISNNTYSENNISISNFIMKCQEIGKFIVKFSFKDILTKVRQFNITKLFQMIY